MKRGLFFLLSALFVTMADVQSQNSDIQAFVSQINKDSLQANVQALQDFGTRYAFSNNRRQVAEYLCERLQSYGFEAKLDSFHLEMEYPYSSGIMNDTWQYNVAGKKRGVWAKDTTVHLGAHYDAVSFKEGFEDFINVAPGADDNASGVAALLEIARITAANNLQPIKTLVFNFFAAEEQGLKGSNHTINSISTPMWKEDIVAMINLDMVGYCTTEADGATANIITYYNSSELTDMAVEFANTYTTLTPNTTTDYYMQSDSYSYNSYGVRSVFLSEYEFTPHYHTEKDVFSTLNFDYLEQLSRLAAALMYECGVHNDYGTVSIGDVINAEDFDVTLLGNPAQGTIRFQTKGAREDCNVVLYDLEGRKIAQTIVGKGENNSCIAIEGIKSGIYVLKFSCGNQTISKKITILQ